MSSLQKSYKVFFSKSAGHYRQVLIFYLDFFSPPPPGCQCTGCLASKPSVIVWVSRVPEMEEGKK